ncbi:MAG: chitobiase/beta-hexosaminidase C-terminal domain-containing protein [Verrucomicrobia bacterium]|nr:chitobiase/beta-hexosaminidase C-terminal domain-containing protein [Verrucomicrobiota bacterium]
MQLELGSTRALACFDRRLADRNERVALSFDGGLFDCTSELGESAELRTRGRECSASQLNSCSSAWRALLMILALLALGSAAHAQVQVRTLGGGRTTPSGPDAGYVDGNSLQASQFSFPSGVAVDASGNLLIADRDNGAVRKLDLAANRASTILSALNQPVALAFDTTNNLYVLTQGDGLIRRLDRFGNVTLGKVRLTNPTALSIDRNNLLYVTEAGGAVAQIDPATETRRTIRDGLHRPGGIAVLDSGLLAVSETGNHRILLIDPATRLTVQQIGTGAPGFRDGSLASAEFNQPHQLARAPDGSILVSDRFNHRVRLIRPDSAVITLYGVDSKAWEGPECLTCDPIILPGWFDSTQEFAEAREPVGVTVSRDGKVYATEVYYHLVREITGAALTTEPGGGAAGTNLLILPPLITPDSGYFPLGQDITVINPNTNAFFGNTIYYTTDDTDPTTNSFRLALSNSVGTIRWRETTRSLTSLRVVAFVGTKASEVVKGKPASRNELGVTRDLEAGPGSTLVVPIAVNLRPTDELKSLQYRVEVSPLSSGAPPIPERYEALSTSTNDFIPYATSTQSGGRATFGVLTYTNTAQARGVAIAFIGADSGLSVKNFAVVGMVAVPIPATAKLGDRYRVEVLAPSGTSDGLEAQVPLASMNSRLIQVTATGYLVGNSSPATSYNAPATEIDSSSGALRSSTFGTYGFGDLQIDNSDVNNVFSASLGLRVPFSSTDLFDAMDAYPEDIPGSPGGDGLIRFLDWQVILRRSLALDTAQWVRFWSASGARNVAAFSSPGSGAANRPASALKQSPPGAVWMRQAVVSATPQENISPGVPSEIPVFVTVGAGYRVSGLAFRATLHPEESAPALQQPMQFVPASGLPKPIQSAGLSPNDLLCGWPIVPNYAFEPPLQGKTLLGRIRFTLPNTARVGQTYSLRFSNADGSPDLRTQYDFETRPASVWVQTAALRKPEIISDEWKIHFFRSLTNESAQPDADPDQDGVSNLSEYLAGTNPISAASALHLESARFDSAKNRVVLRWLGAPGRIYTLEANSTLRGADWKTVVSDLPGTGAMQEFVPDEIPSATRFYRLRLQTQDSLE